MRSSFFILESSFVPFLPNIPDNEAWRKGLGQIENLILRKVPSPLVQGISDASFISVCLLKNGGKRIPQPGGKNAIVEKVLHCFLFGFTTLASQRPQDTPVSNIIPGEKIYYAEPAIGRV